MNFNLNNKIKGRVWKFGDSINTDIIAPGGDRGINLRETTMAALRPDFPSNVKSGDILVAGKNFGCGSHREEANLILREIGIKAILAESVARLFFRISISLAFPTFIVPDITSIIEDQEMIEIDYSNGKVNNLDNGKQISFTKFPPIVDDIFHAGGIIPLILKRLENEKKKANV